MQLLQLMTILKNTNDSIEQKARNESKIIFETGTWLIIEPLTEYAAGYFGRETLWCTAAGYGRQASKTNNMFSSYAADEGGIVIIYNKKSPKDSYQLSVKHYEFNNGENDLISGSIATRIITQFSALADYINSDPHILGFTEKFNINFNDVFDSEKLVYDLSEVEASEAYTLLSKGLYRKGDKDTFEDIIATDASTSTNYAIEVLKGEFKKGEEIISSHARSSVRYATKVLGGAFELGEDVISKHPSLSYEYARDALKGRFESGEKVISDDAKLSYKYAEVVLKGRFELGEEAISTDDLYSFSYAVEVLDDRFELGEQTIKFSMYRKRYQEHFNIKL